MTFVRPGDPSYDEVRQPRVARFADMRPSAVARCRTAAEVAATIAYAREEGGGLAVRAGGHCFGGHSSTTGVLIDVSPMDAIELGDGRVTVGGGARLGRIYDALAPHGVAIAGGCARPSGSPASRSAAGSGSSAVATG
jgi:FAD/FMN-containing dehydrogenase